MNPWVWLGPLWLLVGWWFVHTAFTCADWSVHWDGKRISWHRPTLVAFLRWYTGRRLLSPAEIRALEIECGVREPDAPYIRPIAGYEPKPLEPAMSKVWDHMTNQELAEMSVKDYAELVKGQPKREGIFG